MESATSGELVSQYIFESRSSNIHVRERFLESRRGRPRLKADVETSEPELGAKSSHSCQVLHVEDAPLYLRRPFIKTGYLVGGSPLEAAYQTLFGLTNETLNAYTMLPGCVAAIAGVLLARAYLPSETEVFWIFLLSLLPHAPFATCLHLTIGSSEETRNLWRTIDVFFIFNCAVPRAAALGWYVFTQRRHYLAYMALAVGIYAWNIFSCMILRKIKDIPKASLPKAILAAVVCYTAPVLIAAMKEAQTGGSGLIMRLYGAIFILVAIGGVAYACKVPERWAPGCFDLIGNGHQIMHVAMATEYAMELWFLYIMASQKVAKGALVSEQDNAVARLLNETMAIQ